MIEIANYSQGFPTTPLGEVCKFSDTGNIYMREISTGDWVQIGFPGIKGEKGDTGIGTPGSPGSPGANGGNYGQSTIPFASWLSEDSITITGQTGLQATAKIIASIYANQDDIYAQDWRTLIVKDVVENSGFAIILRPEIGTFKGAVPIQWSWCN